MAVTSIWIAHDAGIQVGFGRRSNIKIFARVRGRFCFLYNTGSLRGISQPPATYFTHTHTHTHTINTKHETNNQTFTSLVFENMFRTRRTRAQPATTHTTRRHKHTSPKTRRPSLLSRLMGPKTTAPTTTRGATTTRRRGLTGRRRRAGRPVVATRRKRRPSIGDKISGALLKIRGSLTRRPGLKAAGTRRERGTDGRLPRRGFF